MCPPEFLSDPPLPLIQFHVLLPLKKNRNQLSLVCLDSRVRPAWSVIARSHCMEDSWLFLSPKQSDGHSSHLSLSKLGFCWAWAHAGSVMRDSSGLIGPSSSRLLGQVIGVRLGMVIQNASLGTDIILLTPSSFLLRCTGLNSWIFINELSNWRNKQILTKWDPWWSVIKHAFNQKIGTADPAS